MSGAPAKISVKDLGATVMGECKLKQPTCIANPHGPCKTIKVGQEAEQTLCCRQCYDQMVLAGQWIRE